VFRRSWCNWQPELWWKRRDEQPDKQAALSRRAGRQPKPHGDDKQPTQRRGGQWLQQAAWLS
jgi:hypothetical protein